MTQYNAQPSTNSTYLTDHYLYSSLFILVSLFFLAQLVIREINNTKIVADFIFLYGLISTATVLLCLIKCAIHYQRLLILPAFSLIIIAVSFLEGIDVVYMLMLFLANPVCISFLLISGLHAPPNRTAQKAAQTERTKKRSFFIIFILLALLSENIGSLTAVAIIFILYAKLLVFSEWGIKNKWQTSVFLFALICIWAIGFRLGADQTEILAGAFLAHFILDRLLACRGEQTLIFSSMAEAGLWAGGAIWFSFIGLLLFTLNKEMAFFSLLCTLIILIGFYNLWRAQISIFIVLIVIIITIILEINSISFPFFARTDHQKNTLLSSNNTTPQIVLEAPMFKWVPLNDGQTSPIKYHDSSVQLPGQKLYLFFGSDTHGKDTDNQVRRFNLETNIWSQDQSASPSWLIARSFKDGLYVPGLNITDIRPVAMHSYDQIAWLNSEGCMALLGVPFHHIPTLLLPDRRQLARLWCYDPVLYQWRVLSDSISSPRLFGGALIASNDNNLYALGHHSSEQGLLPIGKESQAPRSGLFRWSSKQPVWYPIDAALETGSQIVGEWDSATAKVITFDDGGRSIRIIDPDNGRVIRIARNDNCIQESSYPPITATSSTPGRIHFIVRKGNVSTLCAVNLHNKQIEFIHYISMPLPMNFHLHYIKEWEGLLIFQSSPKKPNERTAWFMRI